MNRKRAIALQLRFTIYILKKHCEYGDESHHASCCEKTLCKWGGVYNIHLQFQDGSNSPCGQIFSYLENVEKMIPTYRVYQASDYIINWTYEAIISSLIQYHLD